MTIDKINQNHLGMFDLTKGLFMLTIIIIHSVSDYFKFWEYDYTSNYIVGGTLLIFTILTYGISPMFFMLCGYTFRKKPIRKLTANYLKAFIKPYLFVILAVVIFSIIKKLATGCSIIEGLQYQALPYLIGLCPGRIIFGISIASIGPVWFFLVFTLSGILLNIVCHKDEVWLQAILLIILSFLGISLKNITLPFCIQQSLICTVFLFIGMEINKKNILYAKIPWYMWILFIALCIAGSLSGGYIDISQNVWNRDFIDLAIGCISGIFLLFALQKLDMLQGFIFDKIRWIGKNAMWICCIHTVTYSCVPWNILSDKLQNYKPIGILIEFILSLACAIIICIIIEKLKYRKIIKSYK